MSTRERLWDSLFWLLTGTLYAYAVCDCILTATVFEASRQTILGLSALFVAGFLILFFNRCTGLLFLGGLVIFAGVVGVSLLRGGFAAVWLAEGKAVLDELSLFIAGQIPYRERYSQLFVLGLCLLTGFLTALNLQVHFGFFILAGGALLVFATPLYNGWDTSPTALVLILLCFVLLLARRLNLTALSRDESTPAGRYSLLLLPLGLAVFSLAWALPKPDTGWLEEFTPPELGGIADRLPLELGPGSGGTFTPDGGRLGGPVSLGDQPVMDVLANERLYLSGSVRDSYTGSAWTVTDDSSADLTPDDQNRYDTADYPRELVDTQRYYMRYYGMSTGRATIYPGDTRTRTIYTPPFRLSLEPEEVLSLTATPYGTIRADRSLPRGTGYAQEYIAWNLQNSYIVALLRGGAAAGDASGLPGEARAAYLELPGSLPDRVGELAAELTAGLDNDYDKLTAIERYLARFPYTLEPEPVPSGVDFVDYFLFEGREGYCVYYATALAVMGRSLGIPTRYVEGYVMPDSPNENGVYTVTGRQAHAWVEAYFDGFGWVPFEATRPYATVEEETLPPEEESLPAADPRPEPQTEPETAGTESETELDLPVPTEPDSQPEEPEASPLPRPVIVFLLLAAGVAAGALALRGIRCRFRRKCEKLEALPHREAAAAWFVCLTGAAAAWGLPMERGETALAYAERVGDRLWLEGRSLPQLAEIYSRAAYSRGDITAAERDAVRAGYLELLHKLRAERKHPVGYLLDRYILLKY